MVAILFHLTKYLLAPLGVHTVIYHRVRHYGDALVAALLHSRILLMLDVVHIYAIVVGFGE